MLKIIQESDPYYILKTYILLKYGEDVKTNKSKKTLTRASEVFDIYEIMQEINKFLVVETEEFLRKLIKIYNLRNERFYKVLRFAILNNRLPTIQDSPENFNYIREQVLEYLDGMLTEDQVSIHEEIIPNWKWNFEHLTTKGSQQYNVIMLLLDDDQLNEKEKKILEIIEDEYRHERLPNFIKQLYLGYLYK